MDPTKKELYTATRPSGVNVGDPLIFDGWSKIRSNDACNWILLQLVGPTTVGVKATGAGGVDELISTVSDDDILFGAFRVHVAGQVKFYHFLFLGATASGMKKGKASMYESGIFQGLEGAHGKVKFSGLEELSVDSIREQIVKATGAAVDSIVFE